MKSIIRFFSSPSKIIVWGMFIIMAISCTKSSNNTRSITTICKNILWDNTAGESGVFNGTIINKQYAIKSVFFSTSSIHSGLISFQYDASGHLINQQGFTFVYKQDTLVSFTADLSLYSSTSGTGTYTFDKNGYLTNFTVSGTSDNGPVTSLVNYTYDNNGDPVLVTGQGLLNGSNYTFTVTATYLSDKLSPLPFLPIAAPFTSEFGYINFLSRHLVNQWVITVTVEGTIEILTYLYSYKYDSQGRVASMVRSPNNTFTFEYSDCH